MRVLLVGGPQDRRRVSLNERLLDCDGRPVTIRQYSRELDASLLELPPRTMPETVSYEFDTYIVCHQWWHDGAGSKFRHVWLRHVDLSPHEAFGLLLGGYCS